MLGLAVVQQRASIALHFAVFFLIATGEALFDTSAAAILPAVAPRGELAEANARLSGAANGGNQFIGPPLGGLLFAGAAPLPLLLGTGGLLGAATLLSTLRETFRPTRDAETPRGSLWGKTAAGVRNSSVRILRLLADILLYLQRSPNEGAAECAEATRADRLVRCRIGSG
jgi:hypothetical protein